jgi:hypothetical protein
MWSSPDVIGLFSNNVVSFSRNVVLRDPYSHLIWFQTADVIGSRCLFFQFATLKKPCRCPGRAVRSGLEPWLCFRRSTVHHFESPAPAGRSKEAINACGVRQRQVARLFSISRPDGLAFHLDFRYIGSALPSSVRSFDCHLIASGPLRVIIFVAASFFPSGLGSYR